MSTRFYRFSYRIGMTPWENPKAQGGSGEQVAAMFDREEIGREPSLRLGARPRLRHRAIHG